MVADLLAWPATWSGAATAIALCVLFSSEIRFWLRTKLRNPDGDHDKPTDNPAAPPIVTVKLDPAGLPHPDDLKRLQKQVADHAQAIATLLANPMLQKLLAAGEREAAKSASKTPNATNA